MNYKVGLIAHYGEDYLNYRLNFLKYLKEFGADSFAIVPDDKYYKEINKTEFPIYFYSYSRSWRSFLDVVRTYFRYITILKKEKPDVLFTYKFFPNLLGIYVADKLKIKKKIATVAGLGFLENRKKSILINLIFKLYVNVLKKADFIVVQNIDDKTLFERYVSSQKVILTNGSGVNKDKFLYSGVEYVDLLKKKSTEINFLFCSRIIKEKGILELIEAFKNVKKTNKDCRLTIAGWFDNKNIEKLVLESINDESSISFIGYQKDVLETILLSDCVVLPSYYPEGVPRSLTESLALSMPIITTNHKGCKETCIDGVNGFLVKPGDVNDLKEKLIKFLDLSNEEIQQMKRSSLEIFNQKFEESKVFRTITDNIFNE
jgi:glycosyltransferase involved in cell wall biosynthesis